MLADPDLNVGPRRLRCRLRRIVEQVGEHTHHEHWIRLRNGVAFIDHCSDAHVRPTRANGIGLRGRNLGDVDRLRPGLEHSGLDPRHIEQVGDESVETIRLRVDRPEHVGALLIGPSDVRIHQIRHGCLDRCQRAPEVVGDGR